MSIIVRDATNASNLAAVDSDGAIHVNVVAGSSGNAAASPTGSAVPADADYLGINVAGNLVGVSSGNPLPVTGTVTASNPSVGATGSVVPADATMVGGTDGANLRALLTDSAGVQAVNISKWDGTVLTGAPTNFGTAPSGTVIGGNVSIFAGGSALAVDNSGNLFVHLNAGSVGITGSVIATVTGTVTAEIEGHAGGVLDAVVGAPIPANAVLIGGSEAGNIEPLLLDASGFLKVNVAAGSSGNAAASPTGSAVPADADYLGINVAGNLVGVSSGNPLPVTGTVTASNPSVGATGAVVPADATMVGGTDGTDLRALLTDATGQLKVLVENTVPVTGTFFQATQPVNGTVVAEIEGHAGAILDGTAGSPSTGVLTVQGVSGGTAQPISGTVAVTQSTSPWVTQDEASVTQGSTTSGQDGILIQGAVTTAAPTYTTNKTDPLSLNTSGGLRVDGSGVTQPISGTVIAEIEGHAGAVLDGTAGSPSTGVLTIQGVSGGTVVPVSGTVTANAGTGDFATNLAQVNGNTVSTAASGTQLVGIEGHAGATLDATVGVGTAPTNGLVVLEQYNTTQPAPSNAQTLSMQSDQAGNSLIFPGAQFETGATWNSGTALNTVQYPTGTSTPGQVIGGAAIVVQLDQTTTITGGAVTFQGTFDNINWVTINAVQILNGGTSNIIAANPYTFVASTNAPFVILTQGYINIRLLLSTVISGTGTVIPYWSTLSNVPIQGVNLTAIGGHSVAVSANGVLEVGIVSHNNGTLDSIITAATAPTNGLATLAVNQTTAPSLTVGQSVATQCDYAGSLFVKPFRRSQTVAQSTTITSSSSATTILAAQAAGIFADISQLMITVVPGTVASTVFTASLSDGTNTYIYDMVNGSTTTDAESGTQINIPFHPPLPAASAATAWTLTLSVATVTVHITVVASLNKAS